MRTRRGVSNIVEGGVERLPVNSCARIQLPGFFRQRLYFVSHFRPFAFGGWFRKGAAGSCLDFNPQRPSPRQQVTSESPAGHTRTPEDSRYVRARQPTRQSRKQGGKPQLKVEGVRLVLRNSWRTARPDLRAPDPVCTSAMNEQSRRLVIGENFLGAEQPNEHPTPKAMPSDS